VTGAATDAVVSATGGAHLVSGVQEGDERHRGSLRLTYASRAVLLVLVLLLSPSVVPIVDSFSTCSNHLSREGARTAIIVLGPSLNATPLIAFVDDNITFYSNATSDDPGATLTFTIFYDYYQSLGPPVLNPASPVTVNTTGSPGAVVTTYAYDHPGNLTLTGKTYFWVTVFVNDGMDNESTSIQVFVSSPPVNMPPSFLAPPDSFSAGAGSPQNIIIKIADNESDTVTVFWDFGDGTNATNVTVALPPPVGVQLMQTHSWNPRIPGKGGYNQTYFLNVSLSDGLHAPVNSSALVTIVVPTNAPPNILDPGITASENSASPMEQINFAAAASDPEGDRLTWTYNFSDGSVEVYSTGFTAPGLLVWQNATHSFATVGNYSVGLSVSDALVPNQTGNHNVTVRTVVRISLNVPPTALALNVVPSSPVIDAILGYANVTLSVQAWDLNGDNFTLSWNLGVFGTRTNLSVGDAAQRMNPYTFRQHLKCNETGSYNFVVTVTDGRPGHEVRLTAVANISSTNQPPSILEFNHAPYSLGDFAAANESVAFRLVVTDPERDAIELIWDFGDGSAKQYMNRTDYDAKGNLTILVNHTYVLKGNYNVTLVVTDNKVGSAFNHTLTSAMPIEVSVRPSVVIAGWTSWDYISLCIFTAIPVLLVLWGYIGMYRRRKEELRPSPEAGRSGSSTEEGPGDFPREGHEEGG
jgi:hypothetical protein